MHWRHAAYALTRTSQLDLRGDPDSGGVWAPCLSYRDGLFYLVYSNVRSCLGAFKDAHNYVVTAPEITGPWSEPVYLNSIGFDQSFFHDEDGRTYLVGMKWDHRPAHNPFWRDLPAGVLHGTNDGWSGSDRLIFEGSSLGVTEGPHIYRRGGWYYLLVAEGGTFYRHAVSIARSRSITGPYELSPHHPLLTSNGKPRDLLQMAGHGKPRRDPRPASGTWPTCAAGPSSGRGRTGSWRAATTPFTARWVERRPSSAWNGPTTAGRAWPAAATPPRGACPLHRSRAGAGSGDGAEERARRPTPSTVRSCRRTSTACASPPTRAGSRSPIGRGFCGSTGGSPSAHCTTRVSSPGASRPSAPKPRPWSSSRRHPSSRWRDWSPTTTPTTTPTCASRTTRARAASSAWFPRDRGVYQEDPEQVPLGDAAGSRLRVQFDLDRFRFWYALEPNAWRPDRRGAADGASLGRARHQFEHDFIAISVGFTGAFVGLACQDLSGRPAARGLRLVQLPLVGGCWPSGDLRHGKREDRGVLRRRVLEFEARLHAV